MRRLWLNSMTNAAMKEAFAELRPGEEFAQLEQAASSRSEADWIVGMNATRAATIRLRSSFDGAVSLGRVQTPTLAIVARREEEIRAFKPEPYWLVDATFAAASRPWRADGGSAEAQGERIYDGRFHGERGLLRATPAGPRIATEEEAEAIVQACEGKPATITKLEKKEQRENAPMLYDLTTLQREANTRYGFSARRTLAAAQRCYEEHKALTYPRTNSSYLTKDMVAEIKPTAAAGGRAPRVCEGRGVRHRPGPAAARAGGERREGHRPPRDHSDTLGAHARADGLRRQADLRHGRETLPGRVPPGGGVREHARGDDGGGRPMAEGAKDGGLRVQDARQAAAGARLARGLSNEETAAAAKADGDAQKGRTTRR